MKQQLEFLLTVKDYQFLNTYTMLRIILLFMYICFTCITVHIVIKHKILTPKRYTLQSVAHFLLVLVVTSYTDSVMALKEYKIIFTTSQNTARFHSLSWVCLKFYFQEYTEPLRIPYVDPTTKAKTIHL